LRCTKLKNTLKATRKRADASTTIKVVVEKHKDGYVACPIRLRGVVVGQGDTYDAALADITSASAFHVDTFGREVLKSARQAVDVFVGEARVVM